jgi:hypothetical protein
MRAADQLSFEEGCASMREDIAELYDRIEGAAERMQGDIGMGTDERLEIMFGQLGSAVELMLQRMEEESSRDEAVGEDAREQLRREWHEAAERRYALRGSDETEREGLRDRLEVALVRVQERVERVMARLRSLREQHADQPHG